MKFIDCLRIFLIGCLAMQAPALHGQEPKRVRLGDICRLKGQEENRLQGLGLIVGLKGTGDAKLQPTTRTLARMLQSMGGNLSANAQGIPDLRELEATGNVALVMVTTTIPPAGAQQGDQLNCTVNALNAKSLEGGRLVLAYMLGPRADVPTIYGIAEGPVSLPNKAIPTSGVVHNGCKMEATITNSFVNGDRISLILDRDLASFSTAADIQDAINSFFQPSMADGMYDIAQAIDQLHVQVTVPPAYTDKPVMFVKLILDIELPNIKKQKRVVINEREGVIVMGEDVLINPVAINHKSLSIQAGAGSGGFVGFDPASPRNPQPVLKNLVDALNALDVPTEDVIAIIRTLKRNGDLYGEVVIQ
ncbi:MAG: flagellar basal body P-ring protein FlgI [Pirellulaceae bacterium]|nr:flagellar basal body P-ring protein FlgI [Pirellulaceae bacterium]